MEFYIGRFKGVERKTYELEVVTPMFLGGANPRDANPKDVELRIPPIKGMLRFWWRATCAINGISEMKEKEDEIFGSTKIKSSFSVSLCLNDELKSELEFNVYKKNAGKAGNFKVHDNNVNILDYLSYGTYEYKKGKGNQYNKKHLIPTAKFNIRFCFYNSQYKAEVMKAFKCLLSFGGLGAKTRNGFGSIYCIDEDINSLYSDIKDIKDFCEGEPKEYTSFSENAKLFKFSEQESWEKAISEIGMVYRESRTSVESHHSYDKRSLISAPLQVNKQNKAFDERHSKPYFLKVQKLQNGKFLGLILFLPYKYHRKEKLKEYNSACDGINNKIIEIIEKK